MRPHIPIPQRPGPKFFCHECGAWLTQGGVVHDEGEHEPRDRSEDPQDEET